MKKQIVIGGNVKVIFKENGNKVILLGKIIKKRERSLSLELFKKVIYNFKKKVNTLVDFTPTIEKVKIRDKMKVVPWPYDFDPNIHAIDDGC